MVNSQAYEAFLKSLHRGPAQGALTYDQSALEALSASERKLAESLLIERVSSETILLMIPVVSIPLAIPATLKPDIENILPWSHMI